VVTLLVTLNRSDPRRAPHEMSLDAGRRSDTDDQNLKVVSCKMGKSSKQQRSKMSLCVCRIARGSLRIPLPLVCLHA